MEFEGQYLTKSEYLALNVGSTIDDMPFNLLEFEARRQIDIRTQSRAKNIDVIPQEIKLCENKLINSIKEYSNSKEITQSNDIISESIDGYSISKLTPDKIKEIVESHKKDIDDIIRTYLIDVEINGEKALFCGVRRYDY